MLTVLWEHSIMGSINSFKNTSFPNRIHILLHLNLKYITNLKTLELKKKLAANKGDSWERIWEVRKRKVSVRRKDCYVSGRRERLRR